MSKNCPKIGMLLECRKEKAPSMVQQSLFNEFLALIPNRCRVSLTFSSWGMTFSLWLRGD